MNESCTYKTGLNKEREAVISAHFMHNINQSTELRLYSPQEFSARVITISAKLITEQLLPSLLNASDKFILERVAASKIRAKNNFKKYGLNSKQDVGIPEMITEIMFDRQFLKGPKSNYSKDNLVKQIRRLVTEKKPIKMIIPALPYKSSSPLKSRGVMPDLAEVNFLLGLMEIAKAIDLIYQQEIVNTNKTMAMFTVISDGRRFNHFLNEPDEHIEKYQDQLRWWINKLHISSYLEILDYQSVIVEMLPKKMQLEKIALNKKVKALYSNLMMPILDPYNIMDSITKAIKLDPDPESSHVDGRYVPLFRSLIYIVNYSTLTNYVKIHKKNYVDLYTMLTKHLFEPYIELTEKNVLQIKAFLLDPKLKKKPTEVQVLEYLRQSMLQEAWHATIDYLAEIRSDRDLDREPISTCYPDHIRWTIHAKPGQLAILTTTAFGDPVQPWHGLGAFKLTKNKMKLYSLPALFLEGMGALPIMVESNKQEYRLKEQPLFYVYPEIKFASILELLEHIKHYLTRKRKL